jgi:hypothetical protein
MVVVGLTQRRTGQSGGVQRRSSVVLILHEPRRYVSVVTVPR